MRMRMEGVIAVEKPGSGHHVSIDDRLALPLYMAGERCGQRHYIKSPTGRPLATEHFCGREPHDEGEHECAARCGFRWET